MAASPSGWSSISFFTSSNLASRRESTLHREPAAVSSDSRCHGFGDNQSHQGLVEARALRSLALVPAPSASSSGPCSFIASARGRDDIRATIVHFLFTVPFIKYTYISNSKLTIVKINYCVLTNKNSEN